MQPANPAVMLTALGAANVHATTVAASLDALAARAHELGTVEMPLLIGGIVDRTGANHAVQRALQDAEIAAAQLQALGIDPPAANALHTAVRMLEHAPLDHVALLHIGRRIGASIDHMRTAGPLHDAIAVAHGEALIARGDVVSWSVDDLQLLARVLRDPAHLTGLPRELEGARPLVELIVESADKRTTDPGIQRYLDAQAAAAMDPAAQDDIVRSVLRPPIDHTPAAAWARLRALHDAGAPGALTLVPGRLDGLPPFRDVVRSLADGHRPSVHLAQRYRDHWLAAGGEAGSPDAFVDRLVDHPAGQLSQGDWRRLAIALDGDGAMGRAGLPAVIDGVKPFRQVADELAAGLYRADDDVQRYFEVARINRMSADEQAALAGSFEHASAFNLGTQDWHRLSALIEAGVDTGLPAQIEGSKPLREIARELAAGQYRANRHVERYFDVARIRRMPHDEQVAFARSIVERDPGTLRAEQWSQLHALTVAGVDTGLPASLEAAKPLLQTAREHADGQYVVDFRTRRYFEAAKVMAMPRDEQIAAVRGLLARDAMTLDRADWIRLTAILDAGVDTGLPPKLDGVRAIRDEARDIASGRRYVISMAQASPQVQRYFTEWNRRLDPTFEPKLAAALEIVAAGHADEAQRKLVASQWDRLEQLVAGRAPDAQARIAGAVLSIADKDNVNSALRTLRANLAAPRNLPPQFATLHSETMELIDRNLSRLSGARPSRAVAGYRNHPDYGEIGRIRANVSFLQDADLIANRPTPVAEASPPAPGTAAARTDAGETLTW